MILWRTQKIDKTAMATPGFEGIGKMEKEEGR
jgi:hypothetical protein